MHFLKYYKVYFYLYIQLSWKYHSRNYPPYPSIKSQYCVCRRKKPLHTFCSAFLSCSVLLHEERLLLKTVLIVGFKDVNFSELLFPLLWSQYLFVSRWTSFLSPPNPEPCSYLDNIYALLKKRISENRKAKTREFFNGKNQLTNTYEKSRRICIS